MPQQYNIIATQSGNGEVRVYDYFKHPTKVESTEPAKPEVTLSGHSKEGYGLSWNPNKKGLLLSSSCDGSICLWNIESVSELYSTIHPTSTYTEHTGVVNDVAWHKHHGEIFASVGDDKKIMLWDLRKESKKPTHKIDAHFGEILSLDFNPFNEYLLASSGADKIVSIWDVRNLGTPQKHLKQHLRKEAEQQQQMHFWEISAVTE